MQWLKDWWNNPYGNSKVERAVVASITVPVILLVWMTLILFITKVFS